MCALGSLRELTCCTRLRHKPDTLENICPNGNCSCRMFNSWYSWGQYAVTSSNLSIWSCHMEYDFVHKMPIKTEGITSSKWRKKIILLGMLNQQLSYSLAKDCLCGTVPWVQFIFVPKRKHKWLLTKFWGGLGDSLDRKVPAMQAWGLGLVQGSHVKKARHPIDILHHRVKPLVLRMAYILLGHWPRGS